MKIFVRTLNGDRFEIQVNPEDMVADVKKNVETVLGVPAAEQGLIHKGKVLKDETTLEANNVSEKSVIAVMKRKPASTGTSTSSASLKSQGLPAQLEDPFITEGSRDQTQEAEACEKADLRQSLDSLRHTPQFEYILALMPSHPSIVQDFVDMVKEEDPPLFQLIQNNRAYFLCLLLEVEGGTGGNEMEQPHHELQADQTNEPNNGGGDGGKVAESEETEVEQPQAYQTNKPNNGGGDGCNQVGESEENQVEQLPREFQADQTNKPDYNGGDGGNQVGESDEETEVETTKDAQAKTRVDEAEIEDLRNKISEI